jgi:ferredoxin
MLYVPHSNAPGRRRRNSFLCLQQKTKCKVHQMSNEETSVRISKKAFDRLARARREGESYSDVIVRLSSATIDALQRRGEKEIVTSDGRRLTLRVQQDKCLGAMSCVAVAPSVFAIDTSQLGLGRVHEEPLGMRDVEEGVVDSESLLRAAESCPYGAICVKDSTTGEEVFPCE